MPKPVLAVLSWAMPIMRELREMEYQWRADFDFRHDKFARMFALDVIVTPHVQGVRTTVQWFQALAGG